LGALAQPAISDWVEPAPEFVFARLACSNLPSWQYWPTYFPNNPPWHHDYPFADELFVSLLHEFTGIRVKPYQIVYLNSPELFKYPFVYLSEPGFLTLNEMEVKNLGEYIRRGGFIMADDFRTAAYLGGPEELEVLRRYLKLAVPERELVRLDISHPIFHTYYDIQSLDMNPPYPILGDKPQFWGMSDEQGRLQLIANYNNDIGDFWKYLDNPALGSASLKDTTLSIRLGMNYVVYAMTH
jgi:hypothetical protein